jgi:hypothetical protein
MAAAMASGSRAFNVSSFMRCFLVGGSILRQAQQIPIKVSLASKKLLDAWVVSSDDRRKIFWRR